MKTAKSNWTINNVKTVYLPLSECYGLIERVLSPYVGIVGEIADHRPLLENILEEYFYGRTLYNADSMSLLSMSLLTQFNLPTDQARQLLDAITTDIVQAIQRSFQIIYPSREYAFRFLGDSVVITEVIPTHAMRVIVTDSKELETLDGYTPERLRSR